VCNGLANWRITAITALQGAIKDMRGPRCTGRRTRQYNSRTLRRDGGTAVSLCRFGDQTWTSNAETSESDQRSERLHPGLWLGGCGTGHKALQRLRSQGGRERRSAAASSEVGIRRTTAQWGGGREAVQHSHDHSSCRLSRTLYLLKTHVRGGGLFANGDCDEERNLLFQI
jgi:hypothetical protein